MFITVFDRKEQIEKELDITTIQSFYPRDVIDANNTTHIVIVYMMVDGQRIEEEFESDDARQDRLDSFDIYFM